MENETKEERIQRLVKEGIEKAKQEERTQKLVKESIEKAKKGEGVHEEDTKPSEKNKVFGVILIVIITMLLAMFLAFMFNQNTNNQQNTPSLWTIAKELNRKCNDAIELKTNVISVCQEELDFLYANRAELDSTSTSKQWVTDTIKILEKNKANEAQTEELSKERSKIFDKANELSNMCTAAIVASNNNGEIAYGSNDKDLYRKQVILLQEQRDICNEEISYLYANREVLDSGETKYWASDAITRQETNRERIKNSIKEINEYLIASNQQQTTWSWYYWYRY